MSFNTMVALSVTWHIINSSSHSHLSTLPTLSAQKFPIIMDWFGSLALLMWIISWAIAILSFCGYGYGKITNVLQSRYYNLFTSLCEVKKSSAGSKVGIDEQIAGNYFGKHSTIVADVQHYCRVHKLVR